MDAQAILKFVILVAYCLYLVKANIVLVKLKQNSSIFHFCVIFHFMNSALV